MNIGLAHAVLQTQPSGGATLQSLSAFGGNIFATNGGYILRGEFRSGVCFSTVPAATITPSSVIDVILSSSGVQVSGINTRGIVAGVKDLATNRNWAFEQNEGGAVGHLIGESNRRAHSVILVSPLPSRALPEPTRSSLFDADQKSGFDALGGHDITEIITHGGSVA